MERARRKRALDLKPQDQKPVDEDRSEDEGCGGEAQPEQAREALDLLASSAFAEAVYITGYNHSAALYALNRARIYAKTLGHRLLWIQAEDRPPFAYFGVYSKTSCFGEKETGMAEPILPCEENRRHHVLVAVCRRHAFAHN